MTRTPRVTSFDVARLAGVSRAAVSRVFTPGAPASPAMSEKVRRAAEELGYRPNALARSLNTGRTRMIGLLVAYLGNSFYAEAVERLSLSLQARGHHVLLFMATPTVTDTDRVVREILDRQVDGIVLASVTMSSSLARECGRHGVPVLHFNREIEDDDLDVVVTDNLAGGRAVADLLIDAGHERIAYLAGFEGASTQRDREGGFRARLAERGVPLAARGQTNFIRAQAAAATRAMFDRPDRPDAVFVCNDHMAFAAIGVLRCELGLRIPDDVAVVGFDDVPMAAWPEYDLTTIRQGMERMVAAAVEGVVMRIEDPSLPPRRVVVPGELVHRGSTRGG
ncbi:MAG: LacI family DNA-binding transcriptional regulator [Paracoccaceae bacterium]